MRDLRADWAECGSGTVMDPAGVATAVKVERAVCVTEPTVC